MIQTAYFTETQNPRMNCMMGAFVSQRIWGHNDGFQRFASMAVARGTTIIGGVVFHDWDERSGYIAMSAAGDKSRWLTRQVVNDFMVFCFDMMHCQIAVSRTDSKNKESLALCRKIFMQEYPIQRMAGRDKDLHLFTITEEQWRLHPLNKSSILPE